MRDPSESIWREALGRLRALDKAWDEPAARQRERHACQEWMAAQSALPRLAHLARLLDGPAEEQKLLSDGSLACIRVAYDGKCASAVDLFPVIFFQLKCSRFLSQQNGQKKGEDGYLRPSKYFTKLAF